MAVIAILAGLILSTTGYVQNKAGRSRAESEIQALSTACEAYKSDNASYPMGPSSAFKSGLTSITVNATNTLDPRSSGDPTVAAYKTASLFLYTQLSGDLNGDGTVDSKDTSLATSSNLPPPKAYMHFKNDALGRPTMSAMVSSTNQVSYLSDPFGNSYGYSTIYEYNFEKTPSSTPTKGYNPTFDLWSTVGLRQTPNPGQTGDVTVKWIRNW